MTGTYFSYERAVQRVEALKHHGIWPGITCHADGSCSLTFDPAGV
jgi:hypothetical protein